MFLEHNPELIDIGYETAAVDDVVALPYSFNVDFIALPFTEEATADELEIMDLCEFEDAFLSGGMVSTT
jgi:hypothetical protein